MLRNLKQTFDFSVLLPYLVNKKERKKDTIVSYPQIVTIKSVEIFKHLV